MYIQNYIVYNLQNNICAEIKEEKKNPASSSIIIIIIIIIGICSMYILVWPSTLSYNSKIVYT